MDVPEFEYCSVEQRDQEDEGPGGEVGENTCRGPDGLTQLHTTCGQRRGIKVFQVVPEQIKDQLKTPEQIQSVKK